MNVQRAIIADVEKLFVEGFKLRLSQIKDPEIVIEETFTAGNAVIEYLEQQDKTDLLLFMDLNLQDQDGLELIPILEQKFPELIICVVSAYTDYKFVRSALQNGAIGYYSKKNDSIELQKCIDDIRSKETFLSQGLYITPPARKLRTDKLDEALNNGRKKDRYTLKQRLTRREQEVLELITKALNNKEIAQELYISHQTVGVHRKNIMRKLGVRNTVNLIKFAMENQLV